MPTRTDARQAAAAGFRDLSPIMVGMAPFGLVAGIAAVEIGLPTWGATVFSTFVFAGASQLAALELLGADANPLIVIGTIAIINARFLMYSASLAPRFRDEPLRRRAAMAYLLTDQAYAVTIVKLDGDPEMGPRWAYYMGGALPLWAMWQVYTVTGALAGSLVPDQVPLGFAIPLVFAALLVPAVRDRPTLAAAITSGAVAVLGAELPANVGLVLAATAGIGVGTAVSITTDGRAAA
jgi:4-azaleucine resistance transporter AzlC